MTKRIVITAGEPAGIGPDIVVMAAQKSWPAQLICVADRDVLADRARQLQLPLTLQPWSLSQPATPHAPGVLSFVHVPVSQAVQPGVLNTENAGYVLATLNLATDLCANNDADALVTAPVQKSVINDAGIPFSGHTEFLQAQCNVQKVVMLLAANTLRVALATTHLPLSNVPDAITQDSLKQVLHILHQELKSKMGISAPRITVLGLNPHAGEGGHLGREEIEIIAPALEELRAEGLQLLGPLPADTAFNPDLRANTDAYLAMYHDQGLPVLKFAGFGEAVNITLGLPIFRSSVDHGTALSLAGAGTASSGSLEAAIQQAIIHAA